MFGRSYTPEYPRSKEEFIEMINKRIEENGTGVYAHINDAPYDRHYNNQTNKIEEVETEHITYFYITFDEISSRIRLYKEAGYSYYEASDDLKSIPIPHIHFVKIIK